MAEEAAEAHEAVDLVDVQSLAARDPPEPLDIEGELRIVPVRAAAVDAQLPQVEQDAVVEMALVDVLADLTLMRIEILQRALGVEYEAVGYEVDRREVRLQPAASELREVAVGGKPRTRSSTPSSMGSVRSSSSSRGRGRARY